MTLPSLSPVAKQVLVHGLTRAMRTPFVALVAELVNSAPVEGAGTAVAAQVERRSLILADAIDQYGGGMPLEALPRAAPTTDGAQAMMGPWGAALKGLGGPLASVAPALQAFGTVAVQKTALSRLPSRDAAMQNNLMLMLALGAVSHWATGQTAHINLEKWAAESADRSGIIPVLVSGDHVVADWSGDPAAVSAPVAGRTKRSTAGRLFDLADLSRGIADGSVSSTDATQFRRLLPLQNLGYVRWLLDSMENGATHAFGIPLQRAS